MTANGDRFGAGRGGTQGRSASANGWNFRVERERAAVGRLNLTLERTLGECVPESALRALQVALDELLTNVIVHAEQAAGPVEVDVALHAAFLETHIRYFAEAFDPTAWDPAPADVSLSTARIGGRGILLVRALMDEFLYQHDDGCNVVSLRKHW